MVDSLCRSRGAVLQPNTVTDSRSAMVTVRLEGEDLEALDALVELERLSRSDVLRRAIRAYAEKLKVPKRRKR